MKKFLSTLVVASLLGTMAVYAAEVEKGYISANASATKEFAPNVASVVFYINTEDKDLEHATKTNKETTERALNAVKSMLDLNAGDTIQSVNFSAAPHYSNKNNIPIFLYYRVSNGFRVKVKDIQKIGKIMAQGLKNGANRVEDLNFSLDNTESACNSLIGEATKITNTRAKTAANAINSTIIGTKSINVSCSGDESYYPRYKMYTNRAMDSMPMSTDSVQESAMPTEAGTIKLRASANAVYFVK